MEKQYKIKKNDEMFKEALKLGSRIGALGAMLEKDRELTLTALHAFFDRCDSELQKFQDWSVKTANYIDTCNAPEHDDINKKNLKKATKSYKLS